MKYTIFYWMLGTGEV